MERANLDGKLAEGVYGLESHADVGVFQGGQQCRDTFRCRGRRRALIRGAKRSASHARRRVQESPSHRGLVQTSQAGERIERVHPTQFGSRTEIAKQLGRCGILIEDEPALGFVAHPAIRVIERGHALAERQLRYVDPLAFERLVFAHDPPERAHRRWHRRQGAEGAW